jgi:hypothetical protein
VAEWVVVYKSTNLNNVEIVKAVLADNQIDAVLVNKMDSMHKHLINAEIELHVNPKDVINAKHIITKHQL